MADLVITASSVAPVTTGTVTQPLTGTAGATITAGQPVYLDTTTNTYKLTDNDVVGAKTCSGISLNGASSGQPVTIATGGQYTVGATVAVGRPYYASDTAGGICTTAGITSGMQVIFLGFAISATVVQLGIVNTGVAYA